MGKFYFENEWNAILEEQRETLEYTAFNKEVALELGLMIIEIAKNKYHDSVAIRIIEDEGVIFSYKMEGTSGENDWWMDRKLAVSRVSKISSLETYVKSELKLLEPFWTTREANFATCGGCVPIFLKGGKSSAYHVLVSGLPHEKDHQLIIDAICKQLGKEVKSLFKLEL